MKVRICRREEGGKKAKESECSSLMLAPDELSNVNKIKHEEKFKQNNISMKD
jgi:hypothetical protein